VQLHHLITIPALTFAIIFKKYIIKFKIYKRVLGIHTALEVIVGNRTNII